MPNEVSEVAYGVVNGSPEDEAKLIVSTTRNSTDCDTASASAATPEEVEEATTISAAAAEKL